MKTGGLVVLIIPDATEQNWDKLIVTVSQAGKNNKGHYCNKKTGIKYLIGDILASCSSVNFYKVWWNENNIYFVFLPGN